MFSVNQKSDKTSLNVTVILKYIQEMERSTYRNREELQLCNIQTLMKQWLFSMATLLKRCTEKPESSREMFAKHHIHIRGTAVLRTASLGKETFAVLV